MEQLNALEAADMPVLNADEDLFFEQCFVFVRVLRGRPTVPDATYYLSFSFSVVDGLNSLENLLVRSELVVDFKIPIMRYGRSELVELRYPFI